MAEEDDKAYAVKEELRKERVWS